MPRRSVVVVLGAIALLAVASDALRDRAHRSFTSAQRYEDVYYLPPPEWLRVFSLGYDEALADLVWMRALVYFGDELRERGQVRYVFEYARAITTLDPHFRAAYRWVGMAALYRPVAIDAADVERAVEFMEQGARLFPEDGELAWDIGATLAYELPPLLADDEARRRANERALPYLLTAVRRGAAPEWASLSNAAILAEIGRDEQAARHLEEMYLAVSDPTTRAELARRIEQLRDRTRAQAFLAAMDELDRERRADFPYLTPSLYLLVGPRPPVDRVAPIREGHAAALSADRR